MDRKIKFSFFDFKKTNRNVFQASTPQLVPVDVHSVLRETLCLGVHAG